MFTNVQHVDELSKHSIVNLCKQNFVFTNVLQTY